MSRKEEQFERNKPNKNPLLQSKLENLVGSQNAHMIIRGGVLLLTMIFGIILICLVEKNVHNSIITALFGIIGTQISFFKPKKK